MAFNIPLPGMPGDALLSGFNTVSTQMARLLQAKLQREQMAQQGQQFDQSFGLQQAQENRLAALSPFQQRLLQAQTQQAEQEAAQLAFQQNMFKNLLGGQMPGSVVPAPTSTGMVDSSIMVQPGGSTGFESMMQNPLVAGLFKKATGIDPYSESPTTKSEREFRDFTRKEEYKLNQPQDVPTQQTVNNLQRVVLSSNSLIPKLEKLANMPAPGYGGFFSPNDRAAYEDVIVDSIEDMLGAYNLTSTVENSRLMHKKLERKFGEYDSHYQKRIKDTLDEVKAKQRAAQETLKDRKVDINPISHGNKDLGSTEGFLIGIDSTGSKVKLRPENKNAFLQAGGRLL